VILFTSEAGEELWSESLHLGVDSYVNKSSEGFVRLPATVRSVLASSRRRAATSSREAPYRRLFEALPVGVFIATMEGEVVEANPAFASMLGLFDPSEAAWSNLPALFAMPALAERWRSRLAAAHYVGKLDAQLKRADGGLIWARIASWVVEDPKTGTRHVQGIIEETGDYHATQDALAEKAAALERSNDELEQFAYVVSHDLQQPLSVVSSYLELLADSCRSKLNEEEESYLDRAAGGAVKVQQMVDAVLNYARVDSRGGEFRTVDLGDALEEVKGRLWKEITCAKAVITDDGLPTVEADEEQMKQLLQNLLSNALKFAGGAPARVHVAGEEHEDSWQIAVKDEGIGLDPEAADRVFVMFQRLHTEREYPGTGIGLAICKRIVERHGGRIWVESQPRQGATFLFTIPKPLSRAGL
jgi:PAS domain S-box-containing protein